MKILQVANKLFFKDIQYYIFCFFVVAALISVSISLFSLIITLPRKIQNDMLSKNIHSLHVSVNNRTLSYQLFDNDSAFIQVAYDNVTVNAYIECNDTVVYANKLYNGSGVIFNNTHGAVIGPEVPWSDLDNYAYEDGIFSIFISTFLRDRLNAAIGDILTLRASRDNSVIMTYRIRGDYSNSLIPSFVIPVNSLIGLNYSPSETSVIIFGNQNIYRDIKQYLRKGYDISDKQGYINTLKGADNMLIISSVLLLISSTAGGIIVYCTIAMIIYNRHKTIGLLQMLGMRNTEILMVLYTILQFVISLAILFASLLSTAINSYISDLFGNILGISLQLELKPLHVAASWLLFNIITGISAVFWLRAVNKIQPVSMVKARD